MACNFTELERSQWRYGFLDIFFNRETWCSSWRKKNNIVIFVIKQVLVKERMSHPKTCSQSKIAAPITGRQVPIFSYFFQHTPIFPIF